MPETEVNDYAARDICTGCYMKFDYKGECPECDSEEEDDKPCPETGVRAGINKGESNGK